MERLKEAFSKIKRDVESLNNEISSLKRDLIETREEMAKICEILINLNQQIVEKQEKEEKSTPAHQHTIQTSPAHNPTHNLPLNPLKSQNKAISTGNEGVPTDSQTDRQTDKLGEKNAVFEEKSTHSPLPFIRKNPQEIERNRGESHIFSYSGENPINDAAKILDSLDNIKKEIRLKFKRLTSQEMIVFSTLYQMEEESDQIDYKALAERLKLTESSVRDYIGRLIKKGIPVDKKRMNNKTILLSVSTNLKRIASLSTILQLRDL